MEGLKSTSYIYIYPYFIELNVLLPYYIMCVQVPYFRFDSLVGLESIIPGVSKKMYAKLIRRNLKLITLIHNYICDYLSILNNLTYILNTHLLETIKY